MVTTEKHWLLNRAGGGGGEIVTEETSHRAAVAQNLSFFFNSFAFSTPRLVSRALTTTLRTRAYIRNALAITQRRRRQQRYRTAAVVFAMELLWSYKNTHKHALKSTRSRANSGVAVFILFSEPLSRAQGVGRKNKRALLFSPKTSWTGDNIHKAPPAAVYVLLSAHPPPPLFKLRPPFTVVARPRLVCQATWTPNNTPQRPWKADPKDIWVFAAKNGVLLRKRFCRNVVEFRELQHGLEKKKIVRKFYHIPRE